MSDEGKTSPWDGFMWDFLHTTSFEITGKIKITERQVHNPPHSYALTIRNHASETMEVRFWWYNISPEKEAEITTIKAKKSKRFVIPPNRRATIYWRYV